MSENEKPEDLSGINTASFVPDSLSETRPHTGDGMKRAAAKQLIEKFYYQLTDGCGNENCQNENCASCPNFILKNTERNALALQAIQLFKNKATLCEVQPRKVARAEKSQASCSSGGASPCEASSSASSSTVISNVLCMKPSTSSSSLSEKNASIQYLTEEIILKQIKECEKNNSWATFIRLIGATFNNPESLSTSFLQEASNQIKHPSDNDAKKFDEDKDVDEKEDFIDIQSKHKSNQTAIERLNLSEDDVSVDILSLRRSYDALMKIPDLPFIAALTNALTYLAKGVHIDLKFNNQIMKQNPQLLNVFVIVMELPCLSSPEFIERAFPDFCKALSKVPLSGQCKLAKVWAKFGADWLLDKVRSLHQLITVRIVKNDGRWGRTYHINDDDDIASATKVMKILYYASIYGGERDSEKTIAEEKALNDDDENLQDMLQLQGAVGHSEPKELRQPKDDPFAQQLAVSSIDCRKPLVSYDEFVNELLNEYLDVETDYKYKDDVEDNKISFMNHSYILTTASKFTLMYFDNRVRMFNERRTSIYQTLVHGLAPIPFLRLQVRRDHLIDDALVALEMTAMDNPQDLKKQLFIEFDGEQGLDEGGVSKEFFQLVIEEIFNPDFGMFTYNEDRNVFWFNPTSFENDGQFTLIGVVLGLAIYNSTIVDVHFPAVVYRKLMGKKGTFEDLKEVDPTLALSLQGLLDYTEDDIQDIFMMTFQIGYSDVFGSALTHDLKENGSQIPVTHQNKHEFVTLYADFLLNKSIQKQFRAFKRGFQMVVNESPLKVLFKPEEIELLVCGSKVLDFNALEQATEYDGGFTAESTSIKNFWEIVHEFSEEQKRKLLQFTTGTDRVPVGGLSKLKLIIARNGPDSDRLPTAHTCFNVLLLPDYTTKQKMKDLLIKAIENSKGFGML